MKYERLNQWLQVSANIGIVLGLLLVGVQLKQNSDLLKTQLLYEESQRAIELETQVVGENAADVWAKSLTEAKNLTLPEQRIMEAILWSFVEQLRASHMLAELGLLEDDEWRARVDSDAGFYLNNPYGRAWWANFGIASTTLAPELIEAVNARLEGTDPNFTLSYSRRIIDGIETTPAESP